MKFKKIGVGAARINGLNKEPYYFSHHCFWAWEIVFSDTSDLFAFNNLCVIKVGDTQEEAVIFCNGLKENFKCAHIKNKSKVTILFDPDGNVHAINPIGHAFWIDVDDKFTLKLFNELSLWK